MVVSVCLSSNLYYSLLGFFPTAYLFAGLLLRRFAFCACLVYLCMCVCVSLSVCLSGKMIEWDFAYFLKAFSSFYLLHQTSPGGIAPDHMAFLKSAQSVCYPLAM